MNDDPEQAELGRRCLTEADAIILSSPVLCETAWVLRRFFRASREEVGAAIRALTETGNAIFDARAVASGLTLLDAGGDFADGVSAASGLTMGAEMIVTFDRSAARHLANIGVPVITPSDFVKPA